MKNTKEFLILVFIICSSIASAQSLSPVIVSSGGGIGQTNNLILDWTLGETSVDYISYQNRLITEGFHQPSVLVLGVQNEIIENGYHFLLSPNPVLSNLNVQIQSDENSKLGINLTDINGKVISVTMANSKNDSKEIDMTSLECGFYLLSIKNSDGINLQTFKVLKIQ